MLAATDASLPEVYCDLNARIARDLYASARFGTKRDLEMLGLTGETAIGMRFLFNGGDDESPEGEPADIMFVGQFIRDEEYGIVIQMEGGVFWRSHGDGSFSD